MLRRPASVMFLALAALGLAAYNGLGIFNGVTRFAFLSQLPLALPLVYLITGHVVWAVVWAALAAGLWRRLGWARWGTLAAAILSFLFGWLNRWLGGRSDYVTATVPWTLVWGLLGVALAGWIVFRQKS